jgi:Alpha galactosidase C-terminal beta sandwich domain
MLGINDPMEVRDLWRHADLGDARESYTANVAKHGVVFLKLSK